MSGSSPAWLDDVDRPYEYVPLMIKRSHNLFLWVVMLCAHPEIIEALGYVIQERHLESHLLSVVRSVRQAALGEHGGIRLARRSHRVRGVMQAYPHAVCYALDALAYTTILTNDLGVQQTPKVWRDEFETFINNLGDMLDIPGRQTLSLRSDRFLGYVASKVAEESMPPLAILPLFWEVITSPVAMTSFGLSRDKAGFEKLFAMISLLPWEGLSSAFVQAGERILER